LVEVHKEFRLLPETLLLAIAILDHYLEKRNVSKNKIQLIGIVSTLIAAKYEEIFSPEVDDFVYISDGTYNREEVLDAEEDILATLNFSISFTSPLHFLRRFSKAAESDYHLHSLCKYIIECTLLEIKLLKYLPSEIAAGSVYLARLMSNHYPIWDQTIKYYTTYDEVQVRVIASDINNFMHRLQRSQLKATIQKYQNVKYGSVANIPLIPVF